MSGLLGSTWSCRVAGAIRFDCPACGGARPAEERLLQRWLAVLERPLLAVGAPDRYIICGGCARTYRRQDGAPSPASRPLSEEDRAILVVVAAAVFSDSSIRAVEKQAARAVIRTYTGYDFDPGAVRQLLRTARLRWGDPVRRMRRLGCLLDGAAKRRIVGAAYLVSGADHELHPEEGRMLMRLGEALGLTPREVRAALEEARQGQGRSDG